MCLPMRAHWRNLANTIKLVLPSAHPSPQPNGKLISSPIFAQLTAECRRLPFPLITAPSHGGSGPHTCFLRPTRVHNPNGISIGSAVFAQVTVECPYSLQWNALFPSKLSLPVEICTPSNTWFLGPTRVIKRWVQPFLQGSLVWHTDQQTTLLGR